MTSYRRTSYDWRQSSDWLPSGEDLLDAARRRPEALLVIAAGMALLLRGDRRRARAYRSTEASHDYESRGGRFESGRHESEWTSAARERAAHMSAGAQARAAGMRERASQMTGAARDASERMTGYASEMLGQVSETASSYASTASRWVGDAREGVTHRSAQFAETARSFPSELDEAVRDHPIVLGALGVAVGAAIGATLPSTDIENRTLGDARDQLYDAARDARGRMGTAAEQAYEEAQRVADEHGLNAEGVKEMATDVAQTFVSAAAGSEQKDARTGGQSGGQSGAAASGGSQGGASSGQSAGSTSGQSAGAASQTPGAARTGTSAPSSSSSGSSSSGLGTGGPAGQSKSPNRTDNS